MFIEIQKDRIYKLHTRPASDWDSTCEADPKRSKEKLSKLERKFRDRKTPGNNKLLELLLALFGFVDCVLFNVTFWCIINCPCDEDSGYCTDFCNSYPSIDDEQRRIR